MFEPQRVGNARGIGVIKAPARCIDERQGRVPHLAQHQLQLDGLAHRGTDGIAPQVEFSKRSVVPVRVHTPHTPAHDEQSIGS
jgi:hypothetical protein